MSVECVTAVLQHSKAKGAERAMLLALAHHASVKDWTMFVGIKKAAQESGVSLATAKRYLRSSTGRDDLRTISRKGSPVHTNVRQVMPSYAPVQLEARGKKRLAHKLSQIPVVKSEGFGSPVEPTFGSPCEPPISSKGRSTTTRDPQKERPRSKSQVTVTNGVTVNNRVGGELRVTHSKRGKTLREGLMEMGMPGTEISPKYAIRLAGMFDVDTVLKTFAKHKDKVMITRSPLQYLLAIVKREGGAREKKDFQDDSDWRDEMGL